MLLRARTHEASVGSHGWGGRLGLSRGIQALMLLHTSTSPNQSSGSSAQICVLTLWPGDLTLSHAIANTLQSLEKGLSWLQAPVGCLLPD